MFYNKERTNAFLTEHDLEAVVATTNFSVAYFTDFDCWQYRDFRENMAIPGGPNTLFQTYAVVAPDKSPILVTGTGTAQFTSDLEGVDLRTYGGVGTKVPPSNGDSHVFEVQRRAVASAKPTPQEALVAALKDLGVKKGRVGIEFSNLSKASKKYIGKEMKKVDWLDATEFLRLVRMVKTPGEIARMRKAAEITQTGLWKSFKAAKAGVTFGEINQVYLSEVAKLGAVPDHYIYAPKGLGISSSPNYRFTEGEFHMVDTGVIYKQYYSDTGWSLVIGGNREAERMHERLCEVFDSHLDLLVPGTTPSEILRAFAKSYKKGGIEGVGYQGHSIGLQTREHPVINATPYKRISDDIVDISVEIPFEEGMVINIETPLDMKGRGSYQVERTFVVGKKKPTEVNPRRENASFVTGQS